MCVVEVANGSRVVHSVQLSVSVSVNLLNLQIGFHHNALLVLFPFVSLSGSILGILYR